MKKIIAINGSARKNGNTANLLSAFLNGTGEMINAETYFAHELNLQYCTGCLRCNLLKRCALQNDAWEKLSVEILASDILVFASPIYFHHVTGQLKKTLDRFRSFIHVKITESGLEHTPHIKWKKDIVLLLTLGSSSDEDAKPVIDLFRFIVEILGSENRLHIITATRLGVVNQVAKTSDELSALYPKLGLPGQLAEIDFRKNQNTLKQCYELGHKIMKDC